MLWHAGEVKLPKMGPPEGKDKTASSSSLCPWMSLRCVTPPQRRRVFSKQLVAGGEVWGLLTSQEVEGTG